MKEDSFQRNLKINHTQERLESHGKEKVKVQRRMLKQRTEENINIRPSIRLNLKKLPKDWFTPRKSTQKSTSRQTIETQRNLDTLPSNNPESQYSSQRLICSNESTDDLRRTSHFGESLESPTMKKRLAENDDSFFNIQSRELIPLGIESSPHIDNSNDQKFQENPQKKHYTINFKNILQQQKSQQFDLTFSNPISKGKSFSVKRVIKIPLQQKTQQRVSQFHIEPEKVGMPRNVSQRTVQLSRNKETLSNLKRKVRLLSKQQKHRLVPFSLQNTQQMKRTLTKPYFKNDEHNQCSDEVFHKLNELHLPPIAKFNRH